MSAVDLLNTGNAPLLGPKTKFSPSPVPTGQVDWEAFDNPQNILQYSLVRDLENQDLIDRTELNKSDTKLFAHLHLGASMLGTGFESEAVLHTAGWAREMLESLEGNSQGLLLDVPQAKTLLSSMSQLEEAALESKTIISRDEASVFEEISKRALSFARRVKNLSPGESYLMSGGIRRQMGAMRCFIALLGNWTTRSL